MQNRLGSFPPRKIAIFRAIMLGDLLVAVPSFRALRQAFPKAEISLVSLPWAKEFVRRFSKYLDKFVEFPGLPSFPEYGIKYQKVWGFWKKMQAQQFDLVLQMQGDGSVINPFIQLVRAKVTAGYFRPGDYCPNPQTFLAYPQRNHEIRKHLKLLRLLGVPTQGEKLEYPIFPIDEARFRKNIDLWRLEAGNYILIHPGAQLKERQWGSKKFAKIGDFLAERGFQIVLTGVEQEKSLTSFVAKQMKYRVIDLAGQTDLGQIGLLVKNAQLLVSNDTGVSHIASVFKVPSIIISHITNPERWMPFNQNLHKTIPVSKAGLKRVFEEIENLMIWTANSMF